MTEPTDHLADGHRHTPEFTEKVRRNQQKLASQLQSWRRLVGNWPPNEFAPSPVSRHPPRPYVDAPLG